MMFLHGNLGVARVDFILLKSSSSWMNIEHNELVISWLYYALIGTLYIVILRSHLSLLPFQL